ncbi:DNA-directed RNA polymerase subunit N [uncultured archaeon]|nr:DNA-directed RNA polymerase subunit N [uncultured archaeon]
MIVPVRCFSCGKVVGEHYEEFRERVQRGEQPEKVLNDLGIERYCCRRMLFSHVDFIDEIMRHKGVKQ